MSKTVQRDAGPSQPGGPQPPKAECVGPYILGKTLGEGSSGKVKLGIHKDTGQRVAIKILKKEALTSTPSLRRKVEREIAVMKLMDHPHVMKLYDVLQTSRYLFLILEHVEGGELFDFLVKRGRMDPCEAFQFFQQIISGVEYCHKRLICHRDLKPENLLLDSSQNIKIADFGMATLMKEGDGNFCDTSCGSPHYASPEVVRGDKYNGMDADVWSCGVILYALVAGRLPFDDDNLHRLLQKVKVGKFIMPDQLPDDLKDLIRRMLCVNPNDRVKVSEIKRHPWYQEHLKHPHAMDKQSLLAAAEDPEGEEFTLVKLTTIDEDIFRTVQSLGWRDVEALKAALFSDEPSLERVLYSLLLRRKQKIASGGIFAVAQQQQPPAAPTPAPQAPQVPASPASSQQQPQPASLVVPTPIAPQPQPQQQQQVPPSPLPAVEEPYSTPFDEPSDLQQQQQPPAPSPSSAAAATAQRNHAGIPDFGSAGASIPQIASPEHRASRERQSAPGYEPSHLGAPPTPPSFIAPTPASTPAGAVPISSRQQQYLAVSGFSASAPSSPSPSSVLHNAMAAGHQNPVSAAAAAANRLLIQRHHNHHHVPANHFGVQVPVSLAASVSKSTSRSRLAESLDLCEAPSSPSSPQAPLGKLEDSSASFSGPRSPATTVASISGGPTPVVLFQGANNDPFRRKHHVAPDARAPHHQLQLAMEFSADVPRHMRRRSSLGDIYDVSVMMQKNAGHSDLDPMAPSATSPRFGKQQQQSLQQQQQQQQQQQDSSSSSAGAFDPLRNLRRATIASDHIIDGPLSGRDSAAISEHSSKEAQLAALLAQRTQPQSIHNKQSVADIFGNDPSQAPHLAEGDDAAAMHMRPGTTLPSGAGHLDGDDESSMNAFKRRAQSMFSRSSASGSGGSGNSSPRGQSHMGTYNAAGSPSSKDEPSGGKKSWFSQLFSKLKSKDSASEKSSASSGSGITFPAPVPDTMRALGRALGALKIEWRMVGDNVIKARFFGNSIVEADIEVLPLTGHEREMAVVNFLRLSGDAWASRMFVDSIVQELGLVSKP